MLSTSSLRSVWAPPCRGPWHEINLNGSGQVTVRPAITEAVLALNAQLVRFGYRTRRQDTGAQNCRQITGGGGYSLHAYGIALDINWQTNPYGRRLITDFPPAMRQAIKSIRTNSGAQVWGWGGDYDGSKDTMHWEVTCTPRDLASGISGNAAPQPPPIAAPPPPAPNAAKQQNPIPTHPLEDTVADKPDISFHQPPGQDQGVYMFRNGVRYGVRSPGHLTDLQTIASLAGCDPSIHKDDWGHFLFLSSYAINGDLIGAYPVKNMTVMATQLQL